ncbi:M1 family metallopeptidase [Urechidicola vernalis]|uniref:M1 family metallopeptidase n=1 Tax=Urechidicola vernalis TaxID=3075600 RepID=A0ABU2Y660_9FLAO|nr:M1 family metallopeptidase [Urechidicola sp. P050]MDT0552538.1 M1 family metallopeptidase [Urechidicola sp. P050]
MYKKSLLVALLLPLLAVGQNKFAQLEQLLPTPNEYRNAAGAPGHNYYQQQADYKINVELIDEEQKIIGEETITYTNNSPDNLEYLWIQLDQNMRASDSDTHLIEVERMEDFKSIESIKSKLFEFDGGFKIEGVTTTSGRGMKYYINKTMLRIDLDTPLTEGSSISFKIKWWYNINDRMKIGGRSGYEYFAENDNYLYTIAQWFPRMCVYNDVEGWQNKQFLGRGEFALPFGDYEVAITVPSDHIVGATGELANESKVLTAAQRERLAKARTSDTPVIIVTQDEAEEIEKKKATDKKTWVFKAENVRDFAFASSRKFIWDAMNQPVGGKDVLCMSYYPKEGNPLWEQYSTKVVAHTIKTYSKYTIDYPYPVAISVHAASIGMEYPMICFNFGRPEKDGTYTARTKYGMIGVIIHEVGHNFFPMIVNSDERQWTWMDEGLNTFMQYLTEQEFERNYPSRRGPAHLMTNYMRGNKDNISPIMTNSESIWQFGNNAYGKPATGLNILRETIMGRELFDHAFKTYSERWKFKHPTPADFFRTMEDASAVDLDWFWRAWFYTTDHVDISIDGVKWYELNTGNATVDLPRAKELENEAATPIGEVRNNELIKETYNEKDPSLNDFYTTYDKNDVDGLHAKEYDKLKQRLSDEDIALLNSGKQFYEMKFSNKGGIPMPLILEFTFEDNSKETIKIPAEIWRKHENEVTKVFIFDQKVRSVQLDPNLETADTDVSNNAWPHAKVPTQFELFRKGYSRENPMQRANRAGE